MEREGGEGGEEEREGGEGGEVERKGEEGGEVEREGGEGGEEEREGERRQKYQLGDVSSRHLQSLQRQQGLLPPQTHPRNRPSLPQNNSQNAED